MSLGEKKSNFHSESFGFGDSEQAQNTTVPLATTKPAVALRVIINTWNGIKRLHHYTVKTLTGSTLAAGTTLTNPTL